MSEALFIRALDAPMPFDFEHKAKSIIAKRKQLKIGIVGFGTFGQFLAGRLVAAGHQVRAIYQIRPLILHRYCVSICKAGHQTPSSGSLVHVLLTLIGCTGGSGIVLSDASLIRWHSHAGVSNVQN